MSLPLHGLRVVVTRASHQAGCLAAAFEAAGAETASLPLLAVVPPADPLPLERAAAEIERFRWLVLTSTNAVDAVWPYLSELPSGLQIAAVGRATAASLRERGAGAVLTGTDDSSSLLTDLLPRLSPGATVLLPQAADARSTLRRELEAAGAAVTAVVAYDKALPPEAPERARELFAAHPLGWVTFTSPRIGRHFASLFGDSWERRRGELKAASIGRVTSAELRVLGVEPAAQAATPSNEELVAAVTAASQRPDRESPGAGRPDDGRRGLAAPTPRRSPR